MLLNITLILSDSFQTQSHVLVVVTIILYGSFSNEEWQN